MDQTIITDFEVRSLDTICINESQLQHKWYHNLKYMVVGIFFGIIFIKSEVISWFRIQEMFRLQSFHMYGIIGSAVVTGIISVYLIKKFKIKTIYGEPIVFSSKKFNKGQIYGGILFGFGWALTGSLSRAAVCTNWNGRNGCYNRIIKCDCGHLDLWKIQGKAAPLRQNKIRNPSTFLKNYHD